MAHQSAHFVQEQSLFCEFLLSALQESPGHSLKLGHAEEQASAYIKSTTYRAADSKCTKSAEEAPGGEITEEEIGKTDFGYDCIFHSADLDKTFGEATSKEKDAVSHRAKAVESFKKWLTPTNPNFSRFVNFNK